MGQFVEGGDVSVSGLNQISTSQLADGGGGSVSTLFVSPDAQSPGSTFIRFSIARKYHYDLASTSVGPGQVRVYPEKLYVSATLPNGDVWTHRDELDATATEILGALRDDLLMTLDEEGLSVADARKYIDLYEFCDPEVNVTLVYQIDAMIAAAPAANDAEARALVSRIAEVLGYTDVTDAE